MPAIVSDGAERRRPAGGLVRRALAGAALAALVSGCSLQGVVGAEPITYASAISTAEQHLSDARELVPSTSVDRAETLVTDLDRDAHRLTCSESTSLYSNAVNVWLVPGADSAAIVADVRDALVSSGWTRSESVEEEITGDQDGDGLFQQLLTGQDRYELTLSRWSSGDVEEGLQIVVRSPCVANPADKPDTRGK